MSEIAIGDKVQVRTKRSDYVGVVTGTSLLNNLRSQIKTLYLVENPAGKVAPYRLENLTKIVDVAPTV